MEQETFTKNITWDGRSIRLSYCPEYFREVAQLEIRADNGEPLPITETGYKSHFFMTDNPPCLDEIISFVTGWLNEEAKSKKWQNQCEETQQMCLF